MSTTLSGSASRPVPNSIPRPLVRTNQWFIVLTVICAWVTGQPYVLLVTFAVGLSSLVLGFNPVIRLAKPMLRKKPSEYMPEDRDQQQFNQIIATVLLGLAIVSHVAGWTVPYFVFSAMVAVAAFVAILGFCIGCFIRFQWSQYQYRRRQASRG